MQRFGTKRSQVQILSPRPENAGIRKDSGSFLIHFAQSAVFGALCMQRMCNLGERAKDMVPYWVVNLAVSLSTGPKGRRSFVFRYVFLSCIIRSVFEHKKPLLRAAKTLERQRDVAYFFSFPYFMGICCSKDPIMGKSRKPLFQIYNLKQVVNYLEKP